MSEKYDLSPRTLQRAETLLLDPAPARTPPTASPYREALTCLTEGSVRFCLLRDDPRALDDVADVDLLVDARDRRLAFAALERAGFVLRRDRRLRAKWVFVRYTGRRFYVLDVHGACVQGGIEYMDARLLLSRLDTSGPVPRPCREDLFLHLLMHNMLGKRVLQSKHLPVLQALRDAGLDAARLEMQTRRFGTRGLVSHALRHLDTVASDEHAWRRLRVRARAALLCRPFNLIGTLRYRWGDRPRLRRRAVVLALLGPDGSGKTTFADTLQAALHDSPLRPGRVYMGCWGHDLLPMRQARRLTPPQVSHLRLLLHRLGLEVPLTLEERDAIAARPPRRALAGAVLRYAVKNSLFALALFLEMSYRYVRHIAWSRRPLVLTDRYIYDLEFRHGKVPFAHGRLSRRLLYGLFPKPDGVLYLSAPYDLVEKRKPQLDRRQFEAMDAVFQHVLRGYQPLPICTDRPVEDLVHGFLAHHWEDVLQRCNRRA